MMFTKRRSFTRVPRHLQALEARVAREQRKWAHRQNARGRAVLIKSPSLEALERIKTRSRPHRHGDDLRATSQLATAET